MSESADTGLEWAPGPGAPTVVLERARLYFTPARPDPDTGEPRFEFRQIPGHDALALAFTSTTRLVEGCGEFQPWAAVSGESLMADLKAAGIKVVVIDSALDESVRWSAAGPPDASSVSNV